MLPRNSGCCAAESKYRYRHELSSRLGLNDSFPIMGMTMIWLLLGIWVVLNIGLLVLRLYVTSEAASSKPARYPQLLN